MNQRNKLIKEMARTGTTQKELAQFLKIRPWTISDYLRGVTPWNADNYEKSIIYLKSKQNVL
jgi:predicted transcriptional regulator